MAKILCPKIVLSIGLMISSVFVFSQFEDCNQYGNDPANFKGQKCWLVNYLQSYIWKYNKNQRLDLNHFFSAKDDIEEYFKYVEGNNNFYLDSNNMAWGSFWYPCRHGGIANRYRSNTYPKSADLNWAKLKTMSVSELYALSPAEKLDIILGYNDFRITKWELQHRGPERGNTSDDGFCGYCNGSRLAGALLPEPLHDIIVSPPGDNSISVKLSPSDIKAIAAASYMHAKYYLGIGYPDASGKKDPNPALIDVMLRLYLGKYKMPFFMDADPGNDLYNETVLGYDRQVKVRNASQSEVSAFPGTSKVVEVNLTLYLQDELTIDQSNKPTVPILSDKNRALQMTSGAATFQYWVHKSSYVYELYVDNNNKIIDGKWKSTPIDYVWAANGAGDEENSASAPKPGNQNIKFETILAIFQKAVTPSEGNLAMPPPSSVSQATQNSQQKFQTPPTEVNVIQNTDKSNK